MATTPVPEECITAINRIICEVAQVFKVTPELLFDAITKKGVPNFTELENAFTAQILTDQIRRIKITLLEKNDVGKKTFETFDKALNPEATAPEATAPTVAVVDAAATEATVVSAPAPSANEAATAPEATAPEATAPEATAPEATAPAPAPTTEAPKAGGSNRRTKKKRNHLRTTRNHRVRTPQ